MKYTVTDVTTSHILVDFEDGKKALVPIQAGWDKERIEEEISKFIPSEKNKVKRFDSISEVPISLGDTNDLDSFKVVRQRKIDKENAQKEEELKNQREKILKKQEKIDNELINYYEMRKNSYPSIQDQLDSLYHAGVFPKEMEDQIKEIKNRYPKDMKKMTRAQYREYLAKLGVFVVIDGTPVSINVNGSPTSVINQEEEE